MAKAGDRKRKQPEEPTMEEPRKIEDVPAFYEHAVNGGYGPYFVKPDDSGYPDLEEKSAWAAISLSYVIEKREASFGNVAPMHATSVRRDKNKIVGINVGDKSVPIGRFTNLCAIMTGQRLGAGTIMLCKDSYLAIPFTQDDGLNVHVGAATITFPSEGDNLNLLFKAMGKCVGTFGCGLTAGQMKALCAKAVTVVNLAKTNMKFWTSELSAVLNAENKKALLLAVTKQRAASKVSDAVLQLCALLLSVTHADADPKEFLEILTKLDDPRMSIPALTMFGKFPLPSMPKAKDKDVLFTDVLGTPLEVKKLSDVKGADIVLVNDGAIIADGQVHLLLNGATTVYVKPPGTSVFFKSKGKGAKYEKRDWNSMEAKPILGLIEFLAKGGIKGPGKNKDTPEAVKLNPADDDDDD